MNYSAEDIKSAAETMTLIDFRSYISNALIHHREISKNTEHHPFEMAVIDEPYKKITFDRVVFLVEITNNFDKSIYDYQQEINENHKKLAHINQKACERDEEIANIRESLRALCESINNLLISGTLTSILKLNPFQKLSAAIKKNNDIGIELQDVINTLNLKPKFASDPLNDFSIRNGEYENYCILKNKLQQLVDSAITPDKLRQVDELEESRKKISNETRELKFKIIDWREALIKSLNVEYNHWDLRFNALTLS